MAFGHTGTFHLVAQPLLMMLSSPAWWSLGSGMPGSQKSLSLSFFFFNIIYHFILLPSVCGRLIFM